MGKSCHNGRRILLDAAAPGRNFFLLPADMPLEEVIRMVAHEELYAFIALIVAIVGLVLNITHKKK